MGEQLINQLEILFNNSKDFVFFLRKIGNDYEYIYVNKSAQRIFDHPVIGETVFQVMDYNTATYIVDNYNEALEKNEQLEFDDYSFFEYKIHKHETTVNPVCIDGEWYVLAITKEILFDRKSEDKYLFMRSVFFNSFLPTALIKFDGTLIEANPTFLDQFQLSIESARGKKFTELNILSESSREQVLKMLSVEATDDDRFQTQMLTFIDDQNKEHFFTATFSPIYREDEITAIFILFHDVTEYINQGKQLKSASHGLKMFRQALNVAADVTFTNLDGVIIEANDRFVERTGYSREEIIGKTHNIVNSGYHPIEFFRDLWTTIKAGKVWRGEVCNRTKTGETYWVDTTIIPLTNEHGEIFQYIAIHFNVSDKKKLMIELRNIERTFRLITENTNDFITILNANGEINYFSPSYVRRLGYTEDELIHSNYEKLIHPDSVVMWKNLMNANEDTEKDGHIELMLLGKNGNVIWTEGNYTLAYDRGDPTPSQIIMVSREITERKERENSLMFLAYHDSLTQLPNRRYLMNEFPQFVESANANFESFAVLYIDGDNFKDVNDKFGHEMGDEFIIRFGKTLVRSVRKNDLVVRFGGDEFLILISSLSREKEKLEHTINSVIDNIRNNLAEGWEIDDNVFKVSASIGVSVYPYDGTTVDELIESADKALYIEKQKLKK